MSNNNNTPPPSMDDLPTEIVAHVGRLAGREGLPAFRLTGRLAKNATALHFAKICFNSFDISVAPDSLHKLASKASDSKFGPQIQHVTFNVSGTENMTPALFASSWSVFKAFAERGQKVTIQVKVNAIAIHDSAFIETNIHRFMIQVMRANSLKAFVEGPITLDLPSPPKNSRDAPLRSLLFHNLAVSSNTEDINISYSDVSPTAGLNYNTTTKTLLIEGLEVKHLFELQCFFKGLRLDKVIFRNTSVDTTTISKLCATHRPTLSSVFIENADLWDLWSEGDKAPASWKEALIDISRLPALKTCSLVQLRKERAIPAWSWDTVTVQHHPVQGTLSWIKAEHAKTAEAKDGDDRSKANDEDEEEDATVDVRTAVGKKRKSSGAARPPAKRRRYTGALQRRLELVATQMKSGARIGRVKAEDHQFVLANKYKMVYPNDIYTTSVK
ncbi:hypothetical protein KCU91_g16229, partial [Aureobasidium melanogenum]